MKSRSRDGLAAKGLFQQIAVFDLNQVTKCPYPGIQIFHSRLSGRMKSCFRHMLQHLASVNLQVILNIFIEHQIYQKYNLQKRVIQLTFTHAQEPNGGKTAC